VFHYKLRLLTNNTQYTVAIITPGQPLNMLTVSLTLLTANKVVLQSPKCRRSHKQDVWRCHYHTYTIIHNNQEVLK